MRIIHQTDSILLVHELDLHKPKGTKKLWEWKPGHELDHDETEKQRFPRFQFLVSAAQMCTKNIDISSDGTPSESGGRLHTIHDIH